MPDNIVIFERRGSGDFGRGPGEPGKGKILFVVFGSPSQDASLEAAENDPRAPESLSGYLRGKGEVTEIGDGIDFVDFDYTRAIPNETQPGGGQNPSDSRPSEKNEDLVGRDMSFSAGTQTRKLFLSKFTRWRATRTPGDRPPNFGGLIGVDLKTGEIHGCDVLAPATDFTITKRFKSLTLGWFRSMVDKVAMQNKLKFLNFDPGEILFKGCDGQYKDNDKVPWTCTARYGYSRNFKHSLPLQLPADPTAEMTIDDEACTFGMPPEPGDPAGDQRIVVPDIQGWNYVWVITKITTRTFVENGVQRTFKTAVPRWVFVERVYHETDLNGMGFDT